MSKKIIFVLVSFIIISRSHFAFASPVINEIMYDSDGGDIDWVEVYNPDSSDVDLTALKLLISNSTSNHGIVKHDGSEILHSGEYGIIVPTSSITDFTNKWGSAGNIFTASFSLPNDTAKVEINAGDKNLPLSSVTYNSTQGASGDGNSLQLIDSSWTATAPTPNSINKISSPPTSPSGGGAVLNSNTDNSNIAENSSTTTEIKKKEKVVEIPAIKTKITASHLVFSGLPVEFKSSATGLSGEALSYGKYFWNFGDGDSKETNGIEKFTHTYSYAGEYVVSLEYYSNAYSQNPDATDRITIKAVPIQVSISKVGDEKDFFVELTNGSEYEMDLSKWTLSSGSKNFLFSKNTLIMPKKSIIVSGKTTQFVASDAKDLKLIAPTGEVAFDYGVSLTLAVVKNDIPAQVVTLVPEQTVKNTSVTENKNSIKISPKTKEIKETKEPEKISNLVSVIPVSGVQIPAKDLSASVIQNDAIPSNSKNLYSTIAGLVALLGFSAGAVYFIRHNKIVPEADGDFEILDE